MTYNVFGGMLNPTLLYYLGVTQSEFHSQVSYGKTRMIGPPGDDNSLTVSW